MNPPRRIKVGPHDYQIQVVSNVLDDFGNCDTNRFIITVDDGAVGPGHSSTMETVLHEALHAVWALVDLKAEYPDGDDEPGERIINRLAPQLLDLLRRNPRLVEFLVER